MSVWARQYEDIDPAEIAAMPQIYDPSETLRHYKNLGLSFMRAAEANWNQSYTASEPLQITALCVAEQVNNHFMDLAFRLEGGAGLRRTVRDVMNPRGYITPDGVAKAAPELLDDHGAEPQLVLARSAGASKYMERRALTDMLRLVDIYEASTQLRIDAHGGLRGSAADHGTMTALKDIRNRLQRDVRCIDEIHPESRRIKINVDYSPL